jgi:diguanylate cyclase (GGDEF)-like protein/PAS domain S-box-containing protein
MEKLLSRALPELAGSITAGGAAENLLRAVTEHTPVGIFLSDEHGSCRFVNARWCELAGLTQDQAAGDGWAQALHPDDCERVAKEWQQAAVEGRDSIISYRFQRRDGHVVWIDGYASAFYDVEGKHTGWIGACMDVSAHRRTQADLWTQAHTDPLTGLPNRRALDELLSPDGGLDRSKLSLVLIDLDHFKEINDTYGHPVGDQVLIAVADALRSRVRDSDFPIRLGGDEFAVLVRTNQPIPLVKDLLSAIRAVRITCGDSTIAVTASAGTAAMSERDASDFNLFETADHALYRAKRQGRDTYTAHPQLKAA